MSHDVDFCICSSEGRRVGGIETRVTRRLLVLNIHGDYGKATSTLLAKPLKDANFITKHFCNKSKRGEGSRKKAIFLWPGY